MATAPKFKGPATKATAPKKKASKYAGIKAAAPRDPMPFVGMYRLRWTECQEGFNPGKGSESFKVKLEIVEIFEGGEDHTVGQAVMFIQGISGKSQEPGLGRVKMLVMAAAGFDDEEAFDAFAGEDGEFLDAVAGASNEFSKDGQPLIGRLIDCQVTRGKNRDDGDWYREYAWAVVPEEDQEVAGYAS